MKFSLVASVGFLAASSFRMFADAAKYKVSVDYELEDGISACSSEEQYLMDISLVDAFRLAEKFSSENWTWNTDKGVHDDNRALRGPEITQDQDPQSSLCGSCPSCCAPKALVDTEELSAPITDQPQDLDALDQDNRRLNQCCSLCRYGIYFYCPCCPYRRLEESLLPVSVSENDMDNSQANGAELSSFEEIPDHRELLTSCCTLCRVGLIKYCTCCRRRLQETPEEISNGSLGDYEFSFADIEVVEDKVNDFKEVFASGFKAFLSNQDVSCVKSETVILFLDEIP